MNAIYLALAIGLGGLISMQPAINANIAAKLGGPLSAAICSIAISLAMVVATWAVMGRGEMAWSKIPTLPWWALIGGAGGALFVLGGVMVAPKLGVAMFFICIVLGQMIGASIIDQVGAFGLQSHSITWSRALGILLVIAGATLTQMGSWLEW